jgi:surface polysaccharide O-acyltransferase-like enzyme
MYLGDVEIHLWFLYILIGIYLVVPILRIFVSAASCRDLTYFVVIWFLATPLLEVAHRLTGFPAALDIPVVTGYVGYFMMGYLLADVQLGRRGRFLSGLGCVISIAVIFFGTNWLSVGSGPIDAYFYSYFSPPTVLASICGFFLLKDLGQNLGKAGALVRTISSTSFGIFLIHIFVIQLLRNGDFGFRLYSWMAPSVYMIPLTGLAVFFISFVIVFVLRKIPIIKMLVP